MLKDLIAIVDNAEASRGFLQQAAAFAEAQEAHLAITLLTKDYVNLVASPYGLSPIPYDRLTIDQTDGLGAIKALMGKAAIPVEVRGVVEDSAYLHGASRVEGRYADLLLIGSRTSYEDAKLRRRLAEGAIMSSGGPVLILPEEGSLERVRRAAVGWDASAEARRAVRDLMTLLEPGGYIDIVTVDAEESQMGHGQSPGSDIARHLARHGYQVQVHHESSVGRTVSEALQEVARVHDADLLVIGAFAHPRVRDILLGGVTRDLLHEVKSPLLLSR